jgi:hypothetical protein
MVNGRSATRAKLLSQVVVSGERKEGRRGHNIHGSLRVTSYKCIADIS